MCSTISYIQKVLCLCVLKYILIYIRFLYYKLPKKIVTSSTKDMRNNYYNNLIKLYCLNGQFRNKAYNSVRWACLVSLAPKKKEVAFSMAIGANGETHAQVFSQTLQHENS